MMMVERPLLYRTRDLGGRASGPFLVHAVDGSAAECAAAEGHGPLPRHQDAP